MQAHTLSAALPLPRLLPQLVTQVSLLLLLFGTLCGGLAFLSDVARIMVLKVSRQA